VVFDHALKARVINAPDDADADSAARLDLPKPTQLADVGTDSAVAVAAIETSESSASDTVSIITTTTAHSQTKPSTTASTAVVDHQNGKGDDKNNAEHSAEKKNSLELSNLVTSGQCSL
jgi:hypothetical protein